MSSRSKQIRMALGAMTAAGAAAAAISPPPMLPADQSTLARAFAALVAAGLVGLASLPLLLWHGGWRRTVWMGVAVVSLAVGIWAFVAHGSAVRACTAPYDGRVTLIGTEWTPLGRRYIEENPGLSSAEVLFDSAGVAERVWTRASIDRCRLRLGTTHVLWIPGLVVCLLAAAHAWPARPLAPAGTAAPRRPSAAAEAAATAPQYDVFISYRHGGRDGEVARELLLALERDGYLVAIDQRDFAPNASFLIEMERAIRTSRFTVALVSPRYLGSGHCEEEAVLCRVLDMGDRRRRLIPVIVAPVELPAWLFGLVGIDCTSPDPLVDPFDRLRAVLGPPLARSGGAQI